MERVKTYIKGFDELIEGGFPIGSNILLSGEEGCGKTIFSIQILYNAVVKNNENCIYFTFEEKKNSLIKQAKQFSWDLEKLEKINKLKIISIGTSNINKNTIDEMIEIIKNNKSKRVVIDSITTLAYLTPNNCDINEYVVKKFLYSFISKFKEIENLTTIFISQKDEKISNDIFKYLCDGVINIKYDSLGCDFSRNLIIKKMRKTKNNCDIHPLEINERGIEIYNLD